MEDKIRRFDVGIITGNVYQSETGEYVLYEDYEKELAASRDSRTLSAVPSVIKQLMDVLPDSDGEDFDWCWNELTDESQNRVQIARIAAIDLLKELERGIAG